MAKIKRIFMSFMMFVAVATVTHIIHTHMRWQAYYLPNSHTHNSRSNSSTPGNESVLVEHSGQDHQLNTTSRVSLSEIAVIVDNGTNRPFETKIRESSETNGTLIESLRAMHCPNVTDEYTKTSNTSQTFCPRKEKQYSLALKTNISPNTVCNGETSPDFVFLVLSVHTNYKKRASIRNTWGSVQKTHTWPQNDSQLKNNIGVIFLIGSNAIAKEETALRMEANTTDDILQIDMKDSYFNLTLKVLAGLNWVTSQCPSVRLVAKCDDDIFINLLMMSNRIAAIDMTNAILGFVIKDGRIDRKGKYAVSTAAFKDKHYPPYTVGIFYVMSKHVAKSIVTVAEYLPYVNMEDVFITGIVGRVVGVTHKHIPHELYYFRKTATVCDFSENKKMLSKDVKPKLAKEIWQALTRNKTCLQNG